MATGPRLAATATNDARAYSLLYLQLLSQLAQLESGQSSARDLAQIRTEAVQGALELAYAARLLEESAGIETGRALLPLLRATGESLLLLSSITTVADLGRLPLASAAAIEELLANEDVMSLLVEHAA